jgi:hypothetical protein
MSQNRYEALISSPLAGLRFKGQVLGERKLSARWSGWYPRSRLQLAVWSPFPECHPVFLETRHKVAYAL